jgi:hypothetical protein
MLRFSTLPPGRHCQPLKHWCSPVKNKDRSDFIEQEPTNATEEAKQVPIWNEFPFIVAHNLQKLKEPD